MTMGVASSSPARAQRRVRLTVGQSHTIQVSATVTKVHILNPRVADIVDYGRRRATVVGVDGGTTELLVTTTRGIMRFAITVTKVETGRLFKQVRSFLGFPNKIVGIFPRLIGETIVITGGALTADDYGKVQRAVKLFGNQVRNLVNFKPSAVEQINQILAESGLTDVRARLVGGSVFLEGSVGSPDEMKKVNAILRSYGLKVENLVKVGGGRQVLIDVQFVEMRKSGLQEIGVNYGGRYGVELQGALTGTFDLRPNAGDRIQAMQVRLTGASSGPGGMGQLGINALFQNGRARLLAKPRLVCGSGRKAEFHVGGEVPIVIVTNNVANVTFKPFGIILKVKPTADSLGNIRSEIHAEVSEVDTNASVSFGGTSVPGFRTRKFNTFVTVKNGASIVLSGLFTNSEQKNVSKLPLLGHIPILGELFKSRAFREEKTTLVVFVTPRVVSPKHKWVKQSIKEIKKLYNDYEAEVGWKVFD